MSLYSLLFICMVFIIRILMNIRINNELLDSVLVFMFLSILIILLKVFLYSPYLLYDYSACYFILHKLVSLISGL